MATVTSTGTGSPIQVPGLAAGQWRFTVQGVNGAGQGPLSASSAAVTIPAPSPVTGTLWNDEFTAFDYWSPSNSNAQWYPNTPYVTPPTGAPDPAGTSYNACQGEVINGSAVNNFSIISDSGASNGTALRMQCRRASSGEASWLQSNRGCSAAQAAWIGCHCTSHNYYLTFTNSVYIEYRMRLPVQGNGMFPALWLKDANTQPGGHSLNDAAHGSDELDMLEIFGTPQGSSAYRWSSSVYYRTSSGGSLQAANAGRPTTDTIGWHTYGIGWTPSTLRFYQDGNVTGSQDGLAQYFNGAKMGVRLGYPMHTGGVTADSSTPSPLYMDVDYVRVYNAKP